MIIGKGMVAVAIKDLSGWDDDILFSAGVSNSGETDEKMFQREEELLTSCLKRLTSHGSLVYFSTTSIYDPSKSGNEYIRHKLLMEDIIRKSHVNYLILRLPNLVGMSTNPFTLTNYFANCIRENRIIKLNQNAVRHLIDVDDLVLILNDISDRYGREKITVNVETGKPLTARQILSILEDVIKKKAYIQPLTEEAVKNKNTPPLKNSSVNYIWNVDEEYHSNLLRKYYSA